MLRRCFAGGWVAVAVVTTGSLSGCYPAFEFGSGGDSATSTGRSTARSGSGGDDPASSVTTGQGGMATTTGGTGGQGGDAATSSSTGSVMPGPTVACGPGAPAACATGEVCCYNETTASLDACSPSTSCGNGFYLLGCDSSTDCDPGKICCAAYYEVFFTPFFDGVISCESACGYPSLTMCETTEDCSSGETCAPLADLDGSYDAEYRACQ